MRRVHGAAAIAACALLLGGCGSEAANTTPPLGAGIDSLDDTAPEVELEGPAGEPGTLPSGVTIEIVSVAASPADPWVGEDNPGHDTMVDIELRLSVADGEYPLTDDPFGSSGPKGRLYYGPNRSAANAWHVDQERPTLITEGNPVTLLTSYSLPATGLDKLVYEFAPDPYDLAWTFTGVEGEL